jgi:two-component system, NarL family, response regulator YdfI
MIRVLIRAPTPVARAGLESLIRSHPSLQVVGEDADERDTIADLNPDVIVAQIENRDDQSTQELLEEATRGTAVIVLVSGPVAEWRGLFRRGLRGVLPSDASSEQIARAIEAVVAGLVVFHTSETEGLFEAVSVQESSDFLPEALTAREIEILRLLAEGLENKEIALALGISEHTVKFHVASILGKLGVGNRTEAVMSGIRHGIVPI